MSENLLLRLPHRVLTFTVPKLLPPYFRYDRTLFAELMQLIHRMIVDFQSAAAGKPITGGSVLAYQSSGEFLRFHSHVHGIVLEDGFDEQGRFCHIPFGNLQRMAEVFRRRVIALSLERKLIDRSRAASMLSWRHSGFSLDGSIGLYARDQKAMGGEDHRPWRPKSPPVRMRTHRMHRSTLRATPALDWKRILLSIKEALHVPVTPQP